MILIGAPDLSDLPPTCRLRPVPAPPYLNHMTAAWIREIGINAIAFALFATRPDVWQIGGHLADIGFTGRLFALSPPLPNRAMVERELRGDFPTLRLRVLPVLHS